MKLKEINTWWKRGIDKERSRLTNAPKPHKGDRFSVPTEFSNFAPEPGQVTKKTGKKNARSHRS